MLQKPGTGKERLLQADGLCAVGETITSGDIYINKQSPLNTKDPVPNPQAMPDSMFKPSPMMYKGPPGGTIVDKVMLTQNDENEAIFKVSPGMLHLP